MEAGRLGLQGMTWPVIPDLNQPDPGTVSEEEVTLGIEVKTPNAKPVLAVVRGGVACVVVTAVNSEDRTYVEVTVNGSKPLEGKRLHWSSVRIKSGDELAIRVIEAEEGDPPSLEEQVAPATVANGIWNAKQRIQIQIQQLNEELRALEKWNAEGK